MTRTWLLISALLAAVAGAGCWLEAGDQALRVVAVSDSSQVEHIERLTDDERALEGAPWDTTTAAFFRGDRAYVTFDLGAVKPIEAAYLQGDNNDRFILEVSEDGATFRTVWTAPPVAGPGQRGRWESGLGGRGRFVRLRALGGDAFVSATELQLFASKPAVWPPRIRVRLEPGSSIWSKMSLGLFGVLAVLATLLHRRNSKKLVSAAWWGATGIAGAAVVFSIAATWPPDSSVINASRAVSALVACAVVLRLGFWPARARTSLLTGLLAVTAFLSIATFYNFGHPQFHDAAARRPSYVHTWDLRVYFPAAKYFDELGYDGVYLASVKAYADDVLGGSLDRIKSTQLRDLQTYEMKRVSDVSSEIHAVKDRFSPERWSEFKQDMSYFWNAMGRQSYLASLRDHGANATPAWMLVAHVIYGSAEASEATFLWGALLDPVLLLLFFAVAWRTFGLRVALVCLVAYGATTIYQFGSNWGGSTLRNDWMVLLGLGVCALKAKRSFLAGLLLGWSAMIRAFPVLALVFLTVPVGWKLFSSFRGPKSGVLNEPSAFAELRPLLETAAGAAVIALALGVLSTNAFGFDESWGVWSEKIALHANKPNINHLGITALVGYERDNLGSELRARGEDPRQWGPLTARTVQQRRWLIVLGMMIFTVLAVLACRGARYSDAAIIGTMMIPVYFYPANYYLHVIFLWPLLDAAWRSKGEVGRHWASIAAAVLGCCALQWFGWLIPGQYGQFLFWSGTLLVLILVLLLLSLVGPAGRLRPSQ